MRDTGQAMPRHKLRREVCRKECDAEMGRMKATVAAPEWERALELIEDAIPEIKERREGK